MRSYRCASFWCWFPNGRSLDTKTGELDPDVSRCVYIYTRPQESISTARAAIRAPSS